MGNQLPIQKSLSDQVSSRDFSLMQTAWSAILNAFIKRPPNNSLVLSNILVASGNNVINHKLGRVPQGWSLVDSSAAMTVYRNAPFNDLTLTLNSSASGVISLEVF